MYSEHGVFLYLFTYIVSAAKQHKVEMEGHIIGGSETKISRFPHAACLLHYPAYKYICGSSVLNQHVLITAAHCVEEKPGTFSLDAYLGHEDLGKVTVVRKVNRIVPHEHYDQEMTMNDIALLFMDMAVPIGTQSPIKRVAISQEFPLNDKKAEISGWGTVNEDTLEQSTILKFAPQTVLSSEECELKYLYETLPGTMCAGDATSDKNRPARGDSGGGLIVNKFHQVGVVSFTTSVNPGLIFYANVTYYYNWIEETVDKNICEGDIIKCNDHNCPVSL